MTFAEQKMGVHKAFMERLRELGWQVRCSNNVETRITKNTEHPCFVKQYKAERDKPAVKAIIFVERWGDIPSHWDVEFQIKGVHLEDSIHRSIGSFPTDTTGGFYMDEVYIKIAEAMDLMVEWRRRHSI